MPARKRKLLALPLVVISLLLLLAPAGGTQKGRLVLLSVFSPLRSLGRAADLLSPSRGEFQEMRTRNDFLNDQTMKLMNENAVLRGRLAQASHVKEILRGRDSRLLHAAVVIPADSSPWRKSLTIALGSRHGARKGMLVLYHNQLVGRLDEAGPWTSRVRLTIDPSFRAGAVAVPKTYASGMVLDQRHVGVFEGTSGEKGVLKWILGEAPVESGAFVLTTDDPANGVPAGLILGRVASLASSRGAFPRVEVEPALNFRGLEHVMVLAGDEDAP